MGNVDDLVERICRRPPEARFRDVERLLVAFGWRKRLPMRKHWVFEKAGEFPITIPTVEGRIVKRRYLGMVCVRLGLDPAEDRLND